MHTWRERYSGRCGHFMKGGGGIIDGVGVDVSVGSGGVTVDFAAVVDGRVWL